VKHFDIVVVGGGHAGIEAALVAARMGANTALVTMREADLGVLSCNPAMGGVGKGHLIREIDALDGLMGRAADYAGIQFRLLNRSKGPAVQGPRTQVDRARYRTFVRAEIARQASLTLIFGEVQNLRLHAGRVAGVVLRDGSEICVSRVILTTGTFLRGEMHVGSHVVSGGRIGDGAASALSVNLQSHGMVPGRLKTGTPARLDGRSIDWARIELQPGDQDPEMLSFLSGAPASAQVSCGLTHTNARTHDLVRENLEKSAMRAGNITGVGPRYCPSIEDKVERFAAKDSHQVFLEPESLDDDTIYPNGISTSLPADVQEEFVRSIHGLENVRIKRPGYAIEYDYFDPRGLEKTLETRAIKGLYLAGQINGTTGYEEAGAQGIAAGINAACDAIGRDSVLFSRGDSYIGVMIDDLTSRGVTEPYRMFTSRAEFRLSLRADNADQRLTPLGVSLNCVGARRAKAFSDKTDRLSRARAVLAGTRFTGAEACRVSASLSRTGQARSGLELLRQADFCEIEAAHLRQDLGSIAPDTWAQLRREEGYAYYIDRQKTEIDALQREDSREIPKDYDYLSLSSLSSELRGKLERQRPRSISDARKIEGMTPAALLTILAGMESRRA
jgi:tRNA uridine 5-carboxymethylaminomethyl modification enzyme